MLVESIIAGLVVGFFRKDNLRKLVELKWRGIYLPILAFFLETLLGYGLSTAQYRAWILEHTMVLHGIVYILPLIFMLLNLHKRGIFLIYLGTLLNGIVIFANDGYMPVDVTMPTELGYTAGVEALSSGSVFGHRVMVVAQTAWWWLGDVIHVRPPYPFPKTISGGDIVIGIGVFLLLALPLSQNSANLSTNRQNTLEKGI